MVSYELDIAKGSFICYRNSAFLSNFVLVNTSVSIDDCVRRASKFQEEGDSEVEIDLDELLDMENDILRKEFLLKKLHGAKKSRDIVESFVEQLISRAKTL